MKLMALIYLCVISTLLVPNLVGGHGLPEKGVSALFELRLAFHFNFYAASFYVASSFTSFQIVISGVSACSERKLSLQQIGGLYLHH